MRRRYEVHQAGPIGPGPPESGARIEGYYAPRKQRCFTTGLGHRTAAKGFVREQPMWHRQSESRARCDENGPGAAFSEEGRGLREGEAPRPLAPRYVVTLASASARRPFLGLPGGHFCKRPHRRCAGIGGAAGGRGVIGLLGGGDTPRLDATIRSARGRRVCRTAYLSCLRREGPGRPKDAPARSTRDLRTVAPVGFYDAHEGWTGDMPTSENYPSTSLGE